MSKIKTIRFLIRHRGVVRALAKLALGQKDASIYLFPYGQGGKYYYGSQTMRENEISRTFCYADQFDVESMPKLSIHQSGCVHIQCDKENKAGPIYTMALDKWRGEHVASITADSLGSMPLYMEKVKTTGSEIDRVLNCDDRMESIRFRLYCNGESQKFVFPCSMVIVLHRTGMKYPLNIGVAPLPQEPLGDGWFGGMSVLAGWNPHGNSNEEKQFLYIRAQ
jgi:hypothetical protein